MKYSSLVNERSGLVARLSKVNSVIIDNRFYRYVASIVNPLNKELIHGSGSSFNEEEAQLLAVGEAIERYSAYEYFAKGIIKSSEKELEKNYYSINKFTRYKKEQYQEVEYCQEKNEDSEIMWVKCSHLNTNEDVYLPYETVYLKIPPYKPFRDVISTGLACSDSAKRAFESALYECLERDSFMLFWLLKKVNFEYNLRFSSNKKIIKYLEFATDNNLSIRVYNISNDDLFVYTVLTVVRKKGQKGFYFGCATHTSEEIAILKSIKEGISGFVAFYERLFVYKNLSAPVKTEDVRNLDDHCTFYMMGYGDYMLDELFSNIPIRTPQMNCFSLSSLINQLKELNIDIFYKELTTKDIESEGLSVIRVVIPELQYLPVGPPMLESKRLTQIRGNLGLKALNLMPHPFP